jgi:polysaccharide deacetylase family protein (PEP-CTERM system associated)
MADDRERPVVTSGGPGPNAFSIDVEDWYQVSDFEDVVAYEAWDRYESRVVPNTERILSLLDAHGVKGTFFVLTWNAERHPDLVRRIARAGHEVATHGHRHRLIFEQTPAEFREDLTRSKGILEDLTGEPVLGYRAPSFSLTVRSLWALDVMLECGLRYDSSIFPVSDRLYGIRDARRFPFVIRRDGLRELIEFPMSTARVAGRNWPLGGGAYLRVLPYPYIRWGMRRVNAEGQPALVYLHPWEVDPGQPRIKSQGKRGVSAHYVNLRGTERRLVRLLADFEFAPVRDVLGLKP